MNRVTSLILPFVLVGAFGTAVRSQEAPPKEPFKTVHLANLKSAADVAALQAAIADMNKVVADAGHRDIRYRLYKVTGKQAGPHGYLWESSWPSGDAYDKIHQSAAWMSSMQKHPQLDAIMKDELYNRYVEVTAAKK
jgi:hypothetical protein